MRKDAGVDGDAQRLSQLVWMLFLKIFDDQERERELINPKYKSPLPGELRWRNWDNQGILKAIRFGTRGDRRYKKEDILNVIRKK